MEIGSYWHEWEIIEDIGAGSYGEVYKIRREGFGGFTEECALKVIRIPKGAAEYESALDKGLTVESVDRYYQNIVTDLTNEISLMSQFKGNSNIVSFEDYEVEKLTDEFGWIIYIRMELLTPLKSLIRNGDLTQEDVIQLGIDICKALEICESENVIHRDIKEENIFISSHGDYKLGDFGIAKQLDNIYFEQTRIGTPSHMAPEIYKSEAYNSTVDIYSLGVVLYRLLNHNRNPFIPPYPEAFDAEDEKKDETRRVKGDPFPPPANATRELIEVIFKACSYKPSSRFSHAKDMRIALESVREGKMAPFKRVRILTTIAVAALIIAAVSLLMLNLDNKDQAKTAEEGPTVTVSEQEGEAEDQTMTAPEQEEETEAEDQTITTSEQTEEAEDMQIEFPEFNGDTVSVSSSSELADILRSAASGTIIEVAPGEYDLGDVVEINTPYIKIIGVGEYKPVFNNVFYVSSPGVMFENIKIEIPSEPEGEDEYGHEHSGITFEVLSEEECYMKDVDIEMLYYSEYILYGITVYSPLIMGECHINVNDPDGNGNVAVGVGDYFAASGSFFESNDLALDIFGDGAEYGTQAVIEWLINNNTFNAPTKVSSSVYY